MLQRYKYRIKVLNTINFKKSMKYNPFAYLRSEKDILKLVNTIIANTKGDGEKSGEDFWVKAEKLYYTALIGYIWYEAPEDEKNFTTLLEMINASEAREDDEDFQNPVDLMFERLEEKDPEHFAVKQYKKYKLAAGKTAKSILISCGARLAPFDIKELRELMETDEMELDTIGDRKTALFVIISDTDDTFNFVVSILYTQLFIVQDQVWNRVTVNRAERKSTRYFMDEFHLLLKEEQTAAYSVEIWKRFRKWGGIPTAITQNVKDLLASREVENIFENSDFVLMLNQAAGDRAILAKQLNISPQQMKYVTHTEAGEGLIFYGNVVLPFVDRFPKDTELYRVMTTKPEEVGEA